MNGRLPFHLPLRQFRTPGPRGHPHRRRSSEALPRSVIFDESDDGYRCLCGCLHVKTGTYAIAVVELLLIAFYFLNALLVFLEQKRGYDTQSGPEYVQAAFIATAASCALATLLVLLLIAGVKRNAAALLVPHLIMQASAFRIAFDYCVLAFQVIVLFVLFALLIIGAIAVISETALFYRILNAAPFYEHPGQSTVALPLHTAVRVYLVLFVHLLAFVLEIYFLFVVCNCQTYFSERRQYMNYCLAYSKPMETLNSAR
ncbi:hypothetical protein M3Y99_00545400 [Aphelenchoides fujianensis]|nr:hypothetical protein M3Y99_00545400 [Aphelenchoides fujianensis]